MSNTTRNYLTDFNYRVYAHTASASQFESFLRCPRSWWFQKVARMPDVEGQRQFEFGDRLHEACERWLSADDTGRDESGKPIELWPDGWDAGINQQDASIIKRLVQAGIDQGVLRRSPGRRIEAPVSYPGPLPQTPREIVPGVGLCGYRDVAHTGVVEDHKSIKNRRYMKSQDALREDPQLLLYAAIDLIERVEAGEVMTPETKVTLRHNQFVKDPDDLYVRPCEVDVSLAEVEAFWEEKIEPAARDMLRYKKTLKDENRWAEVEGPRVKGACQAYGGCPFARICSKVETPAAHRERIQRINELPQEPLPVTNPQENQTMGAFDRLNKPKAAKPTPATPPPAETEATTTAVAEPDVLFKDSEVEETVELDDTPPWANLDCTACGGSGFNSRGNQCAACDRKAEMHGAPRAGSFTLSVDEEGYTVWTRLADLTVVGRRLLTAPEVKVGDATRTPKPRARIKVDEATTEADDSDTTTESDAPASINVPSAVAAKPSTVKVSADKTTGKGRTGRTATGFIMVYGAVRRSKMKLLDLGEVFAAYGAELAEAQGADSYYSIDRFRRRDLLASKAREIAETIPSSTIVVVRADDPDLRAFATAIEPFATNIIEGIA